MASGEYRSLLGFLTSTFDTFSEMVSIFKVAGKQTFVFRVMGI